MKELNRRQFVKLSALTATGLFLDGCVFSQKSVPLTPVATETLSPDQMCSQGFREPGSVRVYSFSNRLGALEEPEFQKKCTAFKNELFAFLKEQRIYTEAELPETILRIHQSDEGNSAIIHSPDRGYLIRKNSGVFEISEPHRVFDVSGLDYVRNGWTASQPSTGGTYTDSSLKEVYMVHDASGWNDFYNSIDEHYDGHGVFYTSILWVMEGRDSQGRPVISESYPVINLFPNDKYLELKMPKELIEKKGSMLYMEKDPISYIWNLILYPMPEAITPIPKSVIGKWDLLKAEWSVPLDKSKVKTYHWESNGLVEDK